VDKDACSKYFWQKMNPYWVKDTDRKISAGSLTLVIFAAVWAVCGRSDTSQWCNCCHFLSNVFTVSWNTFFKSASHFILTG